LPASYPTSAKTFTTKSDGPGNTILAAHINDLQLEVTAIETDLLAGLPIARGGTGNTSGGTSTWTPTIGGSGGQSGQVYTTQVGTYTKLGNRVTCHFNIVLSTLGTITGDAQIQGLPFTSQNVSNAIWSLSIGRWVNLTSTVVWVGGILAANATVVTLYRATGATASPGAMAQADLSNTTQLIGTISYISST
jgi:hypothetical protein